MGTNEQMMVKRVVEDMLGALAGAECLSAKNLIDT